jgi:tripartite ATP-independent transporter DctP family solute receptor
MVKYGMKIVAEIMMIAVVAITISASSVAAAPVTIKAANVSTDDAPYTLALLELKKLLEKYAPGAFDLQIFANGQLGNERDLVESVGMGTIEAAIVSAGPVINYVRELMIFDMPYLITDLEKAYALMDGPVGMDLLSKFDKIGMKSFHFWSNGYRHFSNDKKEIVHPSDMKGLKMRSMENDVYMELFTVLGATPSPMSVGDFQTAARQGAIDGLDNALPNYWQYRLYEVQHYITLSYHTWNPTILVFNKAFYDSLPTNLQEALKKAEYDACLWERAHFETAEKELIGKMQATGVKFTEIDKNEWEKAVAPVYDKFRNELNPEYLKAFTAIKN